MGLVYAKILLKNPKEPRIKPIDVEALVDTGAMTLCLPQHLAIQLKLEEIEKREVTTADGKKHVVPYAGPVEVKFEGRTCFAGALVFGDSPIMGAVPMEDMDLVIHPSHRQVIINPESPNIPSALVKTAGPVIPARGRRSR